MKKDLIIDNKPQCYIEEPDGSCLGFSKWNDDEPIEKCKICDYCSCKIEEIITP